jgi:CheY-like chemotaxis protein
MDAAHLSVKAKDKASVGYEAVTATNGGDAMAILERRTDIDILFNDVVMAKDMSGLQLAYLAHKLRPESLRVAVRRCIQLIPSVIAHCGKAQTGRTGTLPF